MNILTMSLAKRLAILFSVFLMAGCAATKTFHQYARAGDTVAIAVGWQENWSRENISVWVKEAGVGTPWVQYPANDYRIRAVVNFYPDPLSSMVVSNRTAQNVTPSAISYGNNVTNTFTSGSRDWFNTVVFFDLPSSLALGPAQVYVEEVADVSNFVNTTVEIIETSGGQKHDFEAVAAGALDRKHLGSLERASHYTVTLDGTGEVPHAVQLDFTHDPDVNNGGTGKAYVVEPISGVKSISWADNGTDLRVVMMPAGENTLASFNDFRFYVAGGINNLTPVGTPEAFNINGGDVTGVSPPTVTPHDIVIETSP